MSESYRDRGQGEPRRRERITHRLMDLLAVPSFPGDERACALVYAEMLRDAGMEVELDERFDGSPSVVARLRGAPGPTLQLAGHLDTVPVAHPNPALQDGVVSGRGSSDMKAGLAAFVEVASTLASSGEEFHGTLLVTAYGQHEASPNNTLHEPLRDLLRRGVHGDAALVGDCCKGYVPLKGKGSLIFDVEFSRPGKPEHELFGQLATPNPLVAALRFAHDLQERSAGWNAFDEHLGGETVFFGALHSGDIYNTVPTTARIEGTRRYPLPRTFDSVRSELTGSAEAVAAAVGVEASTTTHRSGQPYELDETSEIVRCLQAAAQLVLGSPVPFGASRFATDVNHIVEVARIPAVLYGVDAAQAHSTPEWVRIDDVLDVTALYLETAREFFRG